jgi:hypothetical protein
MTDALVVSLSGIPLSNTLFYFYGSNVVVEWLTLRFVFGRLRVQNSDLRPVILAEDSRGSPQYFQSNVWMAS